METQADEDQALVYIHRDGQQISDVDILANLCQEAGAVSTEIQNCLKAYSLNTSTKQLENLLKQFKKPVIRQTLRFLHAADRNWDDYKKEQCIHELICRIQNLLIDKCQFCENHYSIAKDEVSLLHCSKCGQGVHNDCLKDLLGDNYKTDITTEEVQELINPFKICSLNFMCLECAHVTLPQSSDGLKKSVAKKSSTTEPEVVVTTEAPPALNNTDTGDITPPPPAKEVAPPHTGDNAPPLPAKEDAPPHTGDNALPLPSKQDTPPQISTQDCALYRIGQCPHGISGKTLVKGERCKFTHRKRCRKFCNFGTKSRLGCQKGNNCQYFHPILCKFSVQRGLCTNLECKFTHLKRTKRFETNRSPEYYYSNYYNAGYSGESGGYGQIHNRYQRDYDHESNATHINNRQNYNASSSPSARVDTHLRPGLQGLRDPATKAISALTDSHATNESSKTSNETSNESIFSFLEQQVQMLKEDFNSQIGDLKTCLLKNTQTAPFPVVSENQENVTQEQYYPIRNDLHVQHINQAATNPHLAWQSQQPLPQQLPHFLQNQWPQSFQSNPAQVTPVAS